MLYTSYVVRMVLYLVTVLTSFTLGMWLLPLKNILARLFGAAMLARTVNAVFLIVIAISQRGWVTTTPAWAMASSVNAVVQTITSVVLLVAFMYFEGTNKNGRNLS